jgi:hypothetical protein
VIRAGQSASIDTPRKMMESDDIGAVGFEQLTFELRAAAAMG